GASQPGQRIRCEQHLVLRMKLRPPRAVRGGWRAKRAGAGKRGRAFRAERSAFEFLRAPPPPCVAWFPSPASRGRIKGAQLSIGGGWGIAQPAPDLVTARGPNPAFISPPASTSAPPARPPSAPPQRPRPPAAPPRDHSP